MAARNLVLLNWNLHGQCPCYAQRLARYGLDNPCHTVVCIQETKLCQIDERLVIEMLGPKFCDNFSFLPSIGMSGGILIAASEDHFKLISSQCTNYTLTVRIQMLNDGTEWSLTGVYGLQLESDKLIFLEELKALKHDVQEEWPLSDDFNLIYMADDKSNARLNRRMMGKLKAILDELELKELPLHGRKFTWTGHQNSQNSQSQSTPAITMTRIDRLLSSKAWEEFFPTAHLNA
jgi:hypothetical protein